MRLVLLFTDTDGCTYSCDNTYPLEHDSVEAAYCEFDNALVKAGDGLFSVFGYGFIGYKFSDGYRPDFITVDDWYERYVRRQSG